MGRKHRYRPGEHCLQEEIPAGQWDDRIWTEQERECTPDREDSTVIDM